MRIIHLFTLTLLLVIAALFCFPQIAQAQKHDNFEYMHPYHFNDEPRGNEVGRVVFYNVENLFDTYDDPEKMDEAFTIKGMYGWSSSKYKRKLHHIYRVLVSVGGWEAPAVIGLCELENRFVLEELLAKTPLSRFDYQIVHEESPDKRGIDVGLIYRKEKFKLIDYQAINVTFPFDTTSRTRDILYVKGRIIGADNVHIYVNHWPSRFGGHLETDAKREFVAQTIRHHVDSIYGVEPNANIIIMGDLNDAPNDDSVLNVLAAKGGDPNQLATNDLYNLMFSMEQEWKVGTHKHEEHWGILDQIVISQPLANRKEGLILKDGIARIYRPDWMLMEEEVRLGKKPFRTFLGARYLGGYSDHLPIYIDLEYTER